MTEITRRKLLSSVVGGIALGPLVNYGSNLEEGTSDLAPQASDTPTVAIVIYPGFTQLDVMGPYAFLGLMMDRRVIIVSKEKGLVACDQGLKFMVEHSYEDCPKNLDAILVGGGAGGTLAAMKDPETIKFIADRGGRAKYVASVCTGSLILAAAGLLDGRKATTHWGAYSVLREFGVQVVQERVVVDGNRFTGAGVSAGLDLSLELLAKLTGDEYARECQSFIEYGPKPKFTYRDPNTKESGMDKYRPMFDAFVSGATEVAKAHRKSKGGIR